MKNELFRIRRSMLPRQESPTAIRRLGLATACCAAWLLCSGAAHAELVRFRLTGTVTVEHELVLPSDVVTGAPFTAYLSYDTSVPDDQPDDPNRGEYLLDPSLGQFEIRLQIGSLEIRNAPDNQAWITVVNDVPAFPGIGSPIDFFAFGMQSVGGPPRSFEPRIAMSLNDPDCAALDSDRLPLNLNIAAFDGAVIGAFGGAIRESYYSIQGQVSEAVRIPEPTAGTLGIWIAASAVALARTRKRSGLSAQR